MRKGLLFLSVVVLSFMFIGKVSAKTISIDEFVTQFSKDVKENLSDKDQISYDSSSKLMKAKIYFMSNYYDINMNYANNVLSYTGVASTDKDARLVAMQLYFATLLETTAKLYGYTNNYVENMFNNASLTNYTLEKNGLELKFIDVESGFPGDYADKSIFSLKISLKDGFGPNYKPETSTTTKTTTKTTSQTTSKTTSKTTDKDDETTTKKTSDKEDEENKDDGSNVEQTTKDEAENPKTSDSASVHAFASLVSFFLMVVGVKKLKKIKLR